MPSTVDRLHVDRFLTDLSVAFVQDNSNFVSDKVFPVVPVQKQSDQFIQYDRGAFWRDEVGPRPLGGRADVADWDFSTDTYLCVEHALAHKVDDRQRANADDPLNLDRQAARLLQTQMAVDNDRRWASEYFTSGVWSTDLDGSGADFTQFDDFSNSEPIKLIDAEAEEVVRLTGQQINTLVAGAKVFRALKNHPNIKDVIKYTQTAIVTEDILARVLGVENFFVARSVENTAVEGATDSFDFIVDETALLAVHAPAEPGLDVPSAGYTFAWSNLLDGAANLMGSAIMRGRDEFAHSDHFEIRSATDLKVVAPDLGVFFDNTVQSSF